MKSSTDATTATPNELAPTRASLLAWLKNLEDDPSGMEFFDTYHRLIYAPVVRRGLRPQDAEDVVAEMVEGVSRSRPN